MKQRGIVLGLFAIILLQLRSEIRVNLTDYGLPLNARSYTSVFNKALNKALESRTNAEEEIVIDVPKGQYDFHPDKSVVRMLYISNHDQDNPKHVGIALECLKNVTIDFNDSELTFHGRMLPISMTSCQGCKLENLHIDFDNPQIAQVEIVENDTINGVITYRPEEWVKYKIKDGNFIVEGEGWEMIPCAGIAFDNKTKHLVYRTSDIGVGTRNVKKVGRDMVKAPWDDKRLASGTKVAMRSYARPCPGIFVGDCKDTYLNNVTIHYAEGMGLIAQMSENICLKGFNVCLRGAHDPRYFTTQADATHFSGCRGTIYSDGGLYEGMMDDAINVHGTYLKVTEIIDSATIVGEYMHPQTYGFRWGEKGDSVQWIRSNTMDVVGQISVIESIRPWDRPEIQGAKQFAITFTNNIPKEVDPTSGNFGVENLTWTPSVYFGHNTIRNNRARGALFSTPRKVVVDSNLFDHTSGCAILLCGDCNGWFETGACKDVTISNNVFRNALTNMFQFTNAVISIYPEIPDLQGQTGYFHDGIVISGNRFETFDNPLLYAKSVKRLTFRGNTVLRNPDYVPFHWNRSKILLERVGTAKID